jgi:hypothetical protein
MTDDSSSDIVIVSTRIKSEILARLVERFGDMVKYVVDIEQKVAAVGGELHADAEEVLLEHGCHQNNLWGANYYPGLGSDDCIEYTSLINIRPSQHNRSMEVEDPQIRQQIRDLTFFLIGNGEPLG